jgi:hypothetical protein
MICCSQSGLTQALYIMYEYIYMPLTCGLHVNLYIFTNNGRIMIMTNDRPDLTSEGAPDIGKTVSAKSKLMSGLETQMELESRIY